MSAVSVVGYAALVLAALTFLVGVGVRLARHPNDRGHDRRGDPR